MIRTFHKSPVTANFKLTTRASEKIKFGRDPRDPYDPIASDREFLIALGERVVEYIADEREMKKAISLGQILVDYLCEDKGETVPFEIDSLETDWNGKNKKRLIITPYFGTIVMTYHPNLKENDPRNGVPIIKIYQGFTESPKSCIFDSEMLMKQAY